MCDGRHDDRRRARNSSGAVIVSGVGDNVVRGPIGVFSDGILRIRNLPAFLHAPVKAAPRSARGLAAIAGWGHKDTASRARVQKPEASGAFRSWPSWTGF
jgi:hypothetical protein